MIKFDNSILKNPPDWQDILVFFRGSELQNFFTKILEDNLKAVIKPQYVDQIPKAIKVFIVRLYMNLKQSILTVFLFLGHSCRNSNKTKRGRQFGRDHERIR